MKRLGQAKHVCAYRLKSGRFVGLGDEGVASYDNLSPSDYFLYFRIPWAELPWSEFGDACDVFDYVLKESNSAAWYSMGKQPLRYGDILTTEDLAFILKPLSYCSEHYWDLPAWPDIGLDPYTVRRP